jgi:hypothetical protein
MPKAEKVTLKSETEEDLESLATESEKMLPPKEEPVAEDSTPLIPKEPEPLPVAMVFAVPIVRAVTFEKSVFGMQKLSATNGDYAFEWDGVSPWIYVTKKSGGKALVPFTNITQMMIVQAPNPGPQTE